ncbi:MAG TPA: RagB/SusD family nutrient uptake outer membrane protein, partial [Ohtaekwangia sp.]|nr:RagB/SusD family nutrient uptake outer membrane protein [Ohtaekwangia sp.]
MKTNIKIYITIALVAVAGLWSCSDDFLEKKPLDSFSEVDVFADAALLTDFVNGTYRGVRHPFDDSENSLTDGLTDNAFNQHGSADAIIKVYTRGEVNPDNGEGVTRQLWNSTYEYIKRTNLFFEKIEDSPIEAVDRTRLEGQMHFLRAFYYFELFRWYGNVPLITRTFTLGEGSFDVETTPAQEIGAFIVSECDIAISQLASSADPGYQLGRASQEAAMALKARTLLYLASPLFNPGNDQDKWIAARDANKAVMELPQYNLVDNASQYGDMFRGENSDEVIWARYFTAVNDQGWGINVWLFPNSEGGWSNTTPTQDLVDS